MPTPVSESQDARPTIIAWMVALVHAHFSANHREASEALDALETFGIEVKFRHGHAPKHRARGGRIRKTEAPDHG